MKNSNNNTKNTDKNRGNWKSKVQSAYYTQGL